LRRVNGIRSPFELDDRASSPAHQGCGHLGFSDQLEGSLAQDAQPQRACGRLDLQARELGLGSQPLDLFGSAVISRALLFTTRGENHAHPPADLSSLTLLDRLLMQPSMARASRWRA
jgi:hypothetical protein